MSDRPMCSTCRAKEAKVKGECMTCHMYRRRTGKQRPAELVKRQPGLNYRRFHRVAGGPP